MSDEGKKDGEGSRSRKDLIADTFWKYFLQHGMVQTIINDVANALHMSKKTLYKDFPGGKEECLYYIFQKIALDSLKQLEKDLSLVSDSDPEEKLIIAVTHVYNLAVPYVIGNAATKEKDYMLENQIVGDAFRDIFQNQLKRIVQEGIDKAAFQVEDIEVTLRFIYGIITESMILIHQDPEKTLLKDTIQGILKILK